MTPIISGLHHITAIASDPQANYDFYTGALGLRLVKRTVNFDDPGTYHFYFGDELGRPGTILTYFPWPGASRGQTGNGQATDIALSVPASSIEFWKQRLQEYAIPIEVGGLRFGAPVLRFQDPDGLRLELIGAYEDRRPGWVRGPIPEEHAIRGIHSVTLTLKRVEATSSLLLATMGLRQIGQECNRHRFAAGEGLPGALLDITEAADSAYGRLGAGIVHHIAWRTPDDRQQEQWRATLLKLGYNVSPVMDRDYFHSIYFPEPGGVLFEIATDSPGFTTDESRESLGSALKIPAWLEPRRLDIESVLPKLDTSNTSIGK